MAYDGTTQNRALSVRTTYWLIIAATLAAAFLLRQADPTFMARLRLLGFDVLQQTLPQKPNKTYPVRIIDIDETSLKAHGNWPWRRDVLARLVEKLGAAGVRAVVFDMVLPEAASTPLDDIPEAVRNAPEYKPLIDKLSSFASADDAFAAAMRKEPVVLGIIGTPQTGAEAQKPKTSFVTIGANINSAVPGFSGATRNIPALEDAATGLGALNWFPDQDQILRRIPIAIRIAGDLYPSLVAETLRIYNGAKTIDVRAENSGSIPSISSVRIGTTMIPTDGDGQLWLAFSRHDPKRSISAASVLDETVAKGELDGRIAIIGTSAPGLRDLRATPLDPVISGVEIHAQALEQLLANKILVRPYYASGMEVVIAIASALLLAAIVLRTGAGIAAGVGFAAVCLFVGGSLWAFSSGLIFDGVFPIFVNSAAYLFGTGYLYYETESERNRGRETLQKIAREMEAAAQIQRTFLPKDEPAGPLADKFEITAVMKPAKSVGGDFYDYFLIDDDRLAFAVGDVSGKGVPAALFMSVSRTVLRTIAFENPDPGHVLTRTNAILARDNTEGMFVTIFYAVIDLKTGEVTFSSAGHDDALLIASSPLACETLHYMGPAIGLFDFAEYPTATRKLATNDTMFLLTDGITEAFNIDGRVFGQERLVRSMSRQAFATAKDLLASITDEVSRFSEGTEQSDDITCVVMRYKG